MIFILFSWVFLKPDPTCFNSFIFSCFKTVFIVLKSKFSFHDILLHLYMNLVLFFLTVAFFLFKINNNFWVLSERFTNFFNNLFSDINYICFLCDQMPNLLTLNIRKEYTQKIFCCWWISFVILCNNADNFFTIILFSFFFFIWNH